MDRPDESQDDRALLSRVDQFLAPLFTDRSLHPLLIVVGLSFVTFGTGLVLLASRSRSLFAIVSVVALVLMSVESVQRDIRRRGFGPTSRIVVGFWTGTLLSAGLIVWLGWF